MAHYLGQECQDTVITKVDFMKLNLHITMMTIIFKEVTKKLWIIRIPGDTLEAITIARIMKGITAKNQEESKNQLQVAEGTGFNISYLSTIKKKSASRTNFAVSLVRDNFDQQTRAKSNVLDKCDKQQLDPKVIEKIKTATFQMYPLDGSESMTLAWRKCHVAIDKSCRRLNHDSTK